MITAVFDLDRTLLPGTTAERIFLRYLIANRVLGVRSAARTLRYVIKTDREDLVRKIRAERPYLEGMHDAVLRLHGRRAALEKILPALSIRGLDFLLWHRDQGHRILLLSGSLPYVVEPLAGRLDIADVICSQLAVESQRVTGKLTGLHPYGEAKATLMLQYGKNHGVDFQLSYCYADHHSDESLLLLFGNPICVNPSERLREIAQSNDWRVEVFG